MNIVPKILNIDVATLVMTVIASIKFILFAEQEGILNLSSATFWNKDWDFFDIYTANGFQNTSEKLLIYWRLFY